MRILRSQGLKAPTILAGMARLKSCPDTKRDIRVPLAIAFKHQPPHMKARPSPLSSRAKARDLRFIGTLMEMFFHQVENTHDAPRLFATTTFACNNFLASSSIFSRFAGKFFPARLI